MFEYPNINLSKLGNVVFVLLKSLNQIL
jgi:hypothetical protein